MIFLLWTSLALAFINGSTAAPSSAMFLKNPEIGETVNNLPGRIKRSEGVCQPGARFKVECNTCLCSSDGNEMACTKQSCVTPDNRSKRSDQVCEPNSVFKKSCNTCRCSSDGTQVVCTRMFCVEGAATVEKEQPSNDAPLLRNERQTRICDPGTVFKKNCNSCTCNDDGTNAACTLKLCL